jgi:hypothetical protein
MSAASSKPLQVASRWGGSDIAGREVVVNQYCNVIIQPYKAYIKRSEISKDPRLAISDGDLCLEPDFKSLDLVGSDGKRQLIFIKANRLFVFFH